MTLVPIELVASTPKSGAHRIVRLHSVTRARFSASALCPKKDPSARFDLADSHLDLVRIASAEQGKMSVDAIHHVAWRVKDEAARIEWRTKLMRMLGVNAVRDCR